LTIHILFTVDQDKSTFHAHKDKDDNNHKQCLIRVPTHPGKWEKPGNFISRASGWECP